MGVGMVLLGSLLLIWILGSGYFEPEMIGGPMGIVGGIVFLIVSYNIKKKIPLAEKEITDLKEQITETEKKLNEWKNYNG